jgi:hypothetical protein
MAWKNGCCCFSLLRFDFRADMANSQEKGLWISLRINQDVFELFVVVDVSVPDKILPQLSRSYAAVDPMEFVSISGSSLSFKRAY